MGFASVPSETRLKEWISRYSDDVLRTCFVLLSDQSLAEDAMQDTFTKAWKNMSQFEGRENASPKTWLMRIAVNTCKDYRRTQWLRHRNQPDRRAAGGRAADDKRFPRAVSDRDEPAGQV